MNILINDKKTGWSNLEVEEINNVEEHFKNLSDKNWEEIKKSFNAFEVYNNDNKCIYKWENQAN